MRIRNKVRVCPETAQATIPEMSKSMDDDSVEAVFFNPVWTATDEEVLPDSKIESFLK